MSRVRIAVNGWDSFTGFLGATEFVNGVSVAPLAPSELARIAANLTIVEVDSNEQVGPSVIMANFGNVSAKFEAALKTGADEEKAAELAKEKEAQDAPVAMLKYTQEFLLEVADKEGIKGVRKIANEYGVKGVQIHALIEEIIEAQQPKEDK